MWYTMFVARQFMGHHEKMSRAAYHREWRAHLRKTKGYQEKKLFTQGVEALRKSAREAFRGIGLGEMNGYTASEVVKNVKVDG